MTAYAATGPFESLFAEAHVYREASDKARNLIVVLGIWLIFGSMALGGATLLFFWHDVGIEFLVAGSFFVTISLVVIWKTTRGYFARPKRDERRDG